MAMARKLFICLLTLAPLCAIADNHGRQKENNGNQGGNNGHHYGQIKAPEIDGAEAVIAMALLGGVISLIKRGAKK